MASKKHNGNDGFADIVYETSTTVHIWEVKGRGSVAKAPREVKWYAGCQSNACSFFTKQKVGMLGWPIGGPYYGPNIKIVGNVPGSIIYDDHSNRSRKPMPEPVPVPENLPVEVWSKAGDSVVPRSASTVPGGVTPLSPVVDIPVAPMPEPVPLFPGIPVIVP